MNTLKSIKTAGFDYSIHYKAWHDDSDEHAARMVVFHCNNLRPFLPTPGPDSVLDIGCGMGFALLALRQLGFTDLRGIDLDIEQVESCRRRGLEVEKVEDTASYLDEHPQTFDLVLMLDVLEHIPMAEQILTMRAVFRAMRPGGRVIVQVPNASALLGCRWRYDDFTHHSTFTERSLTFVLRNAGFENINLPGQGPVRRPPLRMWKRSARAGFRKWLVRYLWRFVLATELGNLERIEDISLEWNLVGTASKPTRREENE
jgi:SAM-dependent methyltransferase